MLDLLVRLLISLSFASLVWFLLDLYFGRKNK